ISRAEFISRVAADPGFLYKKIVGPHLAQSVEDIRPLVAQSDGVVATSVAFYAHIAATLARKPFIVAHLSPGVMFSAYDPLTAPGAPFMDGSGPWRRG